MIASDGRIVWLRDIVTVVSEEGKPVKLRGLMVDVTEQRRMDAAMKQQAAETRWHRLAPLWLRGSMDCSTSPVPAPRAP